MHITRSTLIGIAGAAALAAGCGGGAPKPEQPPQAPAARMAVVPSLVGVRQDEAHARAARSGFTTRWSGFVGRLANGRTPVKCVKVHSQSPVAGERRPLGASITVLEIACKTPGGRFHGVPH
jgi:hypothetical protein